MIECKNVYSYVEVQRILRLYESKTGVSYRFVDGQQLKRIIAELNELEQSEQSEPEKTKKSKKTE